MAESKIQPAQRKKVDKACTGAILVKGKQVRNRSIKRQ